MIPIYEQGEGRGIGLSLEHFRRRFLSLCHQHIEDGRARAFAFIFYDFTDHEFRTVLSDQGVFTSLDRLAGSQLSVFYLHSAGHRGTLQFNEDFIATLGVTKRVRLPCIVFFKLDGVNFKDITVVPLEHADLIRAFHELHGAIDDYLTARPEDIRAGATNWIVSGAKFVSVEVVVAAIDRLLQLFWG